MQSLNRNGIELAYAERGEGGVPMVFIHGWSASKWAMHRQYLCFSQNNRAIALDLRGHGDSDKPRHEYTVESFSDDLAWTIEQLGLDRPLIVGHSLGAYVSLDFAAKYGERTRGIVLLDPPPFAPPAVLSEIFGPLADALDQSVEPARSDFNAQWFLPKANPELKREILCQLARGDEYVTANSWRNMTRFDPVAAAKQVTVPVMNIAAQPGFTTAPDVESLMPQAVFARTVGAGHNLQLEVPDQVNSMIRNFVREYCA